MRWNSQLEGKEGLQGAVLGSMGGASMCVYEGGRRERLSRRNSIEKAQRWEMEEHMPDSVCSSMIYYARHKARGM